MSQAEGGHHLNGEMYCSVGIYTFGRDLLEVAFVPLRSDFTPSEEFQIFDTKLKPRREILGHAHKEYFRNGIDFFDAVTFLEHWFKGHGLAERKRIVPVVYDWATTRPILIDWLGQETFDSIFSKFHRDLYSAGQYLNDVYWMLGLKQPFRDAMKLRRFVSELGVDTVVTGIARVPKSAVERARLVAECYKRMIPYGAFGVKAESKGDQR